MELTPKLVRTAHLKEFKQAGRKFSCLTSYDHMTAGIFDEAGIDVILVGDSAADNSLGYTSTLPVTVDEMISFGRAVSTVSLTSGPVELAISRSAAGACTPPRPTNASNGSVKALSTALRFDAANSNPSALTGPD